MPSGDYAARAAERLIPRWGALTDLGMSDRTDAVAAIIREEAGGLVEALERAARIEEALAEIVAERSEGGARFDPDVWDSMGIEWGREALAGDHRAVRAALSAARGER